MKTKTIPHWATSIALVPFGIDGYPPRFPTEVSPADFVHIATRLSRRSGGGEWACLAYAVSDINKTGLLSPYGKDNPCLKLRSRKGGRVRLLCRFSYMHWPIPQFKLETI